MYASNESPVCRCVSPKYALRKGFAVGRLAAECGVASGAGVDDLHATSETRRVAESRQGSAFFTTFSFQASPHQRGAWLPLRASTINPAAATQLPAARTATSVQGRRSRRTNPIP